MKLKLRSIVSAGELDKERLTLLVTDRTDLGDYLVAQAEFVEGQLTTNLIHTIWFPVKSVEKGDLVVIYTKRGQNKERSLLSDRKSHFFYLDLDNSIWEEQSRGAVILHAPTWESKSTEEIKQI